MRDYAVLINALKAMSNTNSCFYCQGEHLVCEANGCILSNAADAIDELLDELTTIRKQLPHWISVEERLPEQGENVLVCFENGDMSVASVFDKDENITFWRAVTDEGWVCDCDTEPTNWMPLPEPPKVK